MKYGQTDLSVFDFEGIKHESLVPCVQKSKVYLVVGICILSLTVNRLHKYIPDTMIPGIIFPPMLCTPTCIVGGIRIKRYNKNNTIFVP